MNRKDQRRSSRIDSRNLVSYVCLDESGGLIAHGMGRTLNVNETGILLETHKQIDAACILSLSIGLRDDVIDLKGAVVHQETEATGRHRSGIEFHDMDEKVFQALQGYIERFRARESSG